ncbi:MlaD family protein [Candidatus Synechococcus calcipolaris G9]|uniref:MlaD family protein n=1 Tax=Candidatus Synechococcus calcipolaris G9 TaxID=1497997 RepID=A0ABT6F1H8_9SYNE|nr:MlaD family protein [Candidatus Synechococcus calcipolaris]MDG2991636.1 MlaD family protein [Candidatus Synechococcus calcipolaris G9]
MRSRIAREGSVGLFILGGVAIFSIVLLWLRGQLFAGKTYTLEVELQSAPGLAAGTSVRYRGINVGRVADIKVEPTGIIAILRIDDVIIPRNTVPEIRQAGFIGQSYLDFPAPEEALTLPENISAFAPQCDPKLIYCNGDRLVGATGQGLDDFIRTANRFTAALESSGIIDNANVLFTSANRTLDTADESLSKVGLALDNFNELSVDAKEQLGEFSAAARSVDRAANQISSLVEVNRDTITSTLKNLDAAGGDLRVALNSLTPFMNRLQEGQLLENLEALAANGSEAAENLNKISGTLSSPLIMLSLAQTLDAARATFVNTQQITNDLKGLTGDESFKSDLQRLIRVLGRLLSSSQELEQQLVALYAQAQLSEAQSPTSPSSAPSPAISPTNSSNPKEDDRVVTDESPTKPEN